MSLGGVGRNIAEVIARLGGSPSLLSAVGDDEPGRQLVEACRDIGVRVDTLIRSPKGRTATYTALLDGSGELVGAVADMDVFNEVGAELVGTAARGLPDLGLVVCDANLQAAALEQVLACSAEASVPAWFEPVSTAKATRGRCTRPWHLISPNWDELLAMLGRPQRTREDGAGHADWRPPTELMSAIDEAFEHRLAEHLLVTLGPGGVLLASAPSSGAVAATALAPVQELDVERMLAGLAGAPSGVPPLRVRIEPLSSGHLWYRLVEPLTSVCDVTGAGDALLAGTARAFCSGWPLERAVIAGLFCAHLTLFTSGAVAHFLTAELFYRLGSAVAHASRL